MYVYDVIDVEFTVTGPYPEALILIRYVVGTPPVSWPQAIVRFAWLVLLDKFVITKLLGEAVWIEYYICRENILTTAKMQEFNFTITYTY